MLLASALPPRSLNEKEKQPQFSVMKRTGRYMRTLYGSQVKVCIQNNLLLTQPNQLLLQARGFASNEIYQLNFQKNNNRIWHNVPVTSSKHDERFSNLNTLRLIGEIGYIIQPLVHLTCLAKFGKRSWKPWIISLCFDILR